MEIISRACFFLRTSGTGSPSGSSGGTELCPRKHHGGKPIAEDNLPKVCGQNESLLKEEETPGRTPRLCHPSSSWSRVPVCGEPEQVRSGLFIYLLLCTCGHCTFDRGMLQGLDTQGVERGGLAWAIRPGPAVLVRLTSRSQRSRAQLQRSGPVNWIGKPLPPPPVGPAL